MATLVVTSTIILSVWRPSTVVEEMRHEPRPALLDHHTARIMMVDVLIVARTAASGTLD
jgi:hypothetical protein